MLTFKPEQFILSSSEAYPHSETLSLDVTSTLKDLWIFPDLILPISPTVLILDFLVLQHGEVRLDIKSVCIWLSLQDMLVGTDWAMWRT